MKNTSTFRRSLFDGASCYGITLDEHSLSLLESFDSLVRAWNTRMNLVSARDMDRFVEYHLLDSLKVASCVDFSSAFSVLDYGSGAGLPGIPLAIVFPHLSVTLVDSRLKRSRFLEAAVSELPLPNAATIRSRVEDLPTDMNNFYDIVITRATSDLATFFSLTSRFLSPSGTIVAIKGDDITGELKALVSIVDSEVFHISSTSPASCKDVRTGAIVTVSRR